MSSVLPVLMRQRRAVELVPKVRPVRQMAAQDGAEAVAVGEGNAATARSTARNDFPTIWETSTKVVPGASERTVRMRSGVLV
jgi:hypothetical protein